MSEVNNLIDLSVEQNIIITENKNLTPSVVLNYKNPSNNIPSTQMKYSTTGPGTFIASDARNSLDNNPFDKIQKEANFQDDPFEMVFNEADSNISNNTNNNTNTEVITENLLLLGDDLTDHNLNTPKIPSFSRYGSKNSIGQLSSVSSIGSTNSIFGENISLISLSVNSKFIKENAMTSSLTGFDKSEISDELNKGFLLTKNILNSTDTNNMTDEGSKVATKSLMQLNDDISNKTDFLKISKLRSPDGQLISFSTIGSYDSSAKNFCDSNTSFSLQNNDCSILNKKFITDSNSNKSNSLEKSELNNGFRLSENSTLNSTENNSQTKENFSHNNYSIPDDQSTPNRDLQTDFSNSSVVKPVKLKCHKNDVRNRLLKLSISNSSINSPLANCRRNSKTSEDGSSPELSIFNEASNLAELYSQLITNSPSSNNISEDSCDDLMSIKPNWIDSISDIDSDLELLKIPILAEIENYKNISNNSNENDSDIKIITPPKKDLKTLNNRNETYGIKSDLDKLKDKIKQHKVKNNIQDVNEMINDLKGLIFECTQDDKKMEASNLLKSLSSLLGDDINRNYKKFKSNQSNENIEKKLSQIDNTKANVLSHPSIIRQDTFDVDLKDDEDLPDKGAISPENQDNTDPESPQSNTDDNLQEQIDPELAHIVEQIGKLLGGKQNVNIVTSLNQNKTDINGQVLNTNPTYIVVMNTPSKMKISNNNLENSLNNQLEMRGRSQSLSLHDKRVKLPTTTNHATSPIIQCQTPVRSNNYIGRRNSISTTTPARRSIYAQTTPVAPKISSIGQKPPTPQLQQRRSMLIETTKNNASKSIVNLRNDCNTKQLKFKTANNESTLHSKGPLKATIPVKRIAPSIVTSNVNNTSQIYNNKPITSTPLTIPSKLLNKKCFPKACSTPTIVVSSTPTISITTDVISPTQNLHKNRMRYSTTPNSKSNLSVQSSIVEKNRRKSFTNSKSPIKRSEEFAKTLKNFKFGNRAPKPNAPTTLNKENKQPRNDW